MFIMQRLLFLALLFANPLFAQEPIGKIEGVEILQYEDKYEIIFKTQKGHFTSIYIDKNPIGEDSYEVLKKYIILLFKNKEENDYLLQFKDDSVLLIYKDNKLMIEKWENHYSEKRSSSLWYTFKDFFQLFGLTENKISF